MEEIKEILKEDIEKRFYDFNIEELEEDSFEDFKEYVEEWIYVDYDIEYIEDRFWDEIEKIYEDLKDEYLDGKRDDREEEEYLRRHMYD